MTQGTRNRDKSWERAAVLKWTNWYSQNEAGTKYFGITSPGKNNADQGSWCLAKRSEKLLDDFLSLGPSPCLSSLLAVRCLKAVSVKGNQLFGGNQVLGVFVRVDGLCFYS